MTWAAVRAKGRPNSVYKSQKRGVWTTSTRGPPPHFHFLGRRAKADFWQLYETSSLMYDPSWIIATLTPCSLWSDSGGTYIGYTNPFLKYTTCSRRRLKFHNPAEGWTPLRTRLSSASFMGFDGSSRANLASKWEDSVSKHHRSHVYHSSSTTISSKYLETCFTIEW